MRLLNFDSFSKIVSPPDLYKQVHPSIENLREGEATYTPGPITSGGAIHLDLPIDRVIQENTTFSLELLKFLERNRVFKDAELVVLPGLLGGMKTPDGERWKEREYLSFWIAVFSGMKPELVEEYWRNVVASDINWQDFNNRDTDSSSRKKRIRAYRMFEKLSVETANDNKTNCEPFDRLTRFPDSATSLGSTLEQKIAGQLGISLQEVHLNTKQIQTARLAISQNQVFLKLVELGKIPNEVSNSSMVAILNCVASEFSSNI